MSSTHNLHMCRIASVSAFSPLHCSFLHTDMSAFVGDYSVNFNPFYLSFLFSWTIHCFALGISKRFPSRPKVFQILFWKISVLLGPVSDRSCPRTDAAWLLGDNSRDQTRKSSSLKIPHNKEVCTVHIYNALLCKLYMCEVSFCTSRMSPLWNVMTSCILKILWTSTYHFSHRTTVQMVFSSSCTVYGMPDKSPITESTPLGAISPYGRTKLFQEDMFRDLAASDKEWHILLLRWGSWWGRHQRQGFISENTQPKSQQLQTYWVN